jgi:O-antigen/teichoic acid export membrane protein
MQTLRDRANRLLRWSERLLGLNMTYITSGSFWTALRFGVSTIVSVASFIAFGNLLPKEIYGVYSYLISLAGSLNFFVLTGAGTGVMRAFARGQETILPYAIRLQLRYNLLATATIAVAAIYYGFVGNMIFAIALGMLAVVVPLSAVYHTYEFVLMGKKRFDLIAILSSISAVFSVLITVLALFLTHNILILIGVFSFTSLVPTIWAHWYVSKDLPKGNPSAEDVSELRRTSLHLTGAGLVGSLAQYLDKIVLFHVAGAAALAVYGFALAGPDRIKGLLKNWIGIAQPNFAQRSTQEIRQTFYRRLGLATLIGASCALIYIVFSSLFFHLLLPKYLTAITYSQVYALGLIVTPITIYVGLVFNGQNMLKAIYLANITSPAFRIPVFIVCGILWQTWGLVIASLASYTWNALCSIVIWEIESRRLIKKANV